MATTPLFFLASYLALLSVMSARFDQFCFEPQEANSAFTSTSPSLSTSISSTSAFQFGVETGINPSATMLLPVPVQYPPIPFVSACARIAEFERLREELRRMEIVREKQVERLHALAGKSASYELDVPQV
jgi:hypothetical protein